MENAGDTQEPGRPEAPHADEAPGWASVRPGSGRPKWLSAITISAIVLGSLFGCCGIAGIGGLIAGRAMTPAIMQQQQQGNDARMARIQHEYMKRSAAFQARIFPLSMTTSALGLLHAAGLIAAGVLAYRARPLGRRMLSVLCLAGVAVELVSGYVGLHVAQEQNTIMAPMMDDMMKVATEPKAKQSEDGKRAQEMARGFMATAFKAGNLFSWLTLVGFFVVKSGYYVACALYLRRSDVAAYFDADPAESGASPA